MVLNMAEENIVISMVISLKVNGKKIGFWKVLSPIEMEARIKVLLTSSKNQKEKVY